MTRYYFDDARLIKEILDVEWNPAAVAKPKLYYGAFEEASQHTFVQDSRHVLRVEVRAEDIEFPLLGMSYDFQGRSRIVRVNVAGRKREDVIKASNEIMRIMMKYRILPGNDWDILKLENDIPIYLAHKFSHKEMAFRLIDYCQVLPHTKMSERKMTKQYIEG